MSEIGARSIEESLRQQEFADIEFRTLGAERYACLKGSLPIWRIVGIARAYDGDAERTAAHFGWPLPRVKAAFNYYETYAAEIDPVIDEQAAVNHDVLKRLLPQIERVAIPVAGNDAPAP